MKIVYDDNFDSFESDQKSRVFQVFPDVYSDNRGSFSEVLKSHGQWPKDDMPLWFTELNWIRQINRSASQSRTIRGCHAQKSLFCQAKFVESLTVDIFDIITDARPQSKTFGTSSIYLLSPIKQNKLWVPRGFLHAFVVPETDKIAIFQYFCDNVYNKDSEFGINPMSIVPKLVEKYKNMSIENNAKFECQEKLFELFDNQKNLNLSNKDINGLDYSEWMSKTKEEFEQTDKLWYTK